MANEQLLGAGSFEGEDYSGPRAAHPRPEGSYISATAPSIPSRARPGEAFSLGGTANPEADDELRAFVEKRLRDGDQNNE